MSTTIAKTPSPPSTQHTTKNTLLSLVQNPRGVLAWLSVTPNWLRAAIVASALLSTVFALAIRHAAEQQLQTIQTIGKDSAPSITAGQEMRASLADMHGDLANELLVAPGQGKEAVAGFDKRLREAADNLLSAARNVTYPGEVPPLRTVLNELPRYAELAGRARVLHDQGNSQFVDQHQAADEIMRNSLLPAIDQLITVNQHELDTAYASEKTAATVAWLLVLFTGAALLTALVGLKVLLFKRMRRIFNPPLILAIALTATACLWALVALWESSADIRVGKEDAFESIKVLEAARAAAYDANGDESRWLLVKFHGNDPQQIQLYADAFRDKAAKIAAYRGRGSDAELRAEINRTQKAPAGLQGYLAEELNNITFPKELQAAEETLLTFLDYLKIDQQIRDLKDEQKAVELCTGTKAGQSNWAFNQFDTALQSTIAINNQYFQSSLGDAAGWLAGLDWVVPLGLAIAVSLLTFLGLRRRLHEYAVS